MQVDSVALMKMSPCEEVLTWVERYEIDKAVLREYRRIAGKVAKRYYRKLKVSLYEAKVDGEVELTKATIPPDQWRAEYAKKVVKEDYAKSFWIFLANKLRNIFNAMSQKCERQDKIEDEKEETHFPKPATPPTPDQELEAVELQGRFRSLKPLDQRIALRSFEGATTKEMAKEFGVTDRAIRYRLKAIFQAVTLATCLLFGVVHGSTWLEAMAPTLGEQASLDGGRPPPLSRGAEARVLVFSDDFEVGLGDWLVDHVVWQVGTPTGPGYAGTTSLDGNYPDAAVPQLRLLHPIQLDVDGYSYVAFGHLADGDGDGLADSIATVMTTLTATTPTETTSATTITKTTSAMTPSSALSAGMVLRRSPNGGWGWHLYDIALCASPSTFVAVDADGPTPPLPE